jgi:tagaturonate epimerase
MENKMETLNGYQYYPDSQVEADGTTYGLVRGEQDQVKYLAISGSTDGFTEAVETGTSTLLFPLTAENVAVLRQRLPSLVPQPLGLRTTAGFGDRLGLATPGHVQAVRGTGVAPIFAQQSVRENARTHRTPQQVMDDAAWGVFQTGWNQPWGADADHLKTQADIDSFFDAGFTFFTIDPGDHVDNAAQTDPASILAEKVHALPWEHLRSSPEEIYRLYMEKQFEIEDFTLELSEIALLRAMAKYGRAIAHTLHMAEHLAARAGSKPYDLEISVDETETPTSAAEHFFVASELRRLGVRWISMAPRFVGRFEKGVDYIGDTNQFEQEFARHAAIARSFENLGGSYRMSMHSGSDKFSIYQIAFEKANGLLHLKTAGTSYLEALRVIAQVDTGFFREILQLAMERYEIDRASYHVSAQLENVHIPQPDAVQALPALLDQFDARQVFHVTFGAALDRFGPQIQQVLRAHETDYYNTLKVHFKKHLAPISG